MDVSRARLRERRAQTIALLGIFGGRGEFFNARPGSGPEGHAWHAGSDAGIWLTYRRAEGGDRLV
jgi:hypothetical protein